MSITNCISVVWMYTIFMNKHTKIVATLGPASADEKTLTKLIQSGVNVFRLNFSHNTHEGHQENHDMVRKVAKKLGAQVAILQDLSGPKIRTGELATPEVTLVAGKKLILTTDTIVGDATKMSVSYKKLPQEIKKGDVIRLHDGIIELVVEKISGKEIHTKIVSGTTIKPRRGVNIPGGDLSISSLTTKDKKDLLFGIKNKVDFIAFSFVRTAAEVRQLKKLIAKHGANIPVVSKIETSQAIENIEEIVDESDVIMVARGDLAVEVPAEDVPIYQKEMVSLCRESGKQVIVATQMLESMVDNSLPTRAEVSDVANAVFDGTDAVMLSAESAVGNYPVKTVEMMSKICKSAEVATPRYGFALSDPSNFTTAVTHAAMEMSDELDLAAIVVLTESGYSARMAARYRSDLPIIALTPNESTARMLTLSYGVDPQIIPAFGSVDETMKKVPGIIRQRKEVKKGDNVLVIFGTNFGNTGSSNTMMVMGV